MILALKTAKEDSSKYLTAYDKNWANCKHEHTTVYMSCDEDNINTSNMI